MLFEQHEFPNLMIVARVKDGEVEAAGEAAGRLKMMNIAPGRQRGIDEGSDDSTEHIIDHQSNL